MKAHTVFAVSRLSIFVTEASPLNLVEVVGLFVPFPLGGFKRLRLRCLALPYALITYQLFLFFLLCKQRAKVCREFQEKTQPGWGGDHTGSYCWHAHYRWGRFKSFGQRGILVECVQNFPANFQHVGLQTVKMTDIFWPATAGYPEKVFAIKHYIEAPSPVQIVNGNTQ